MQVDAEESAAPLVVQESPDLRRAPAAPARADEQRQLRPAGRRGVVGRRLAEGARERQREVQRVQAAVARRVPQRVDEEDR